ncbi:unnamed protein product [Brugia timori]|uniref:Uncharacterized protein n=1 Tax=Brugia timori TaxID=42155 RepID=A0A0R3QEU0_9BILA|nr:unnamed protein product [Brugia timori]
MVRLLLVVFVDRLMPILPTFYLPFAYNVVEDIIIMCCLFVVFPFPFSLNIQINIRLFIKNCILA